MSRQELAISVCVGLFLLATTGGCSGSKSSSADANNAAKSQSTPVKSGSSPAEGSGGKKTNQQNTEQITQQFFGEWVGDAVIVDEKALTRFAETVIPNNGDSDAAKRAEAVKEFVTSQRDRLKGTKHLLVFKKDGSYTQTSWGTGAYGDGKPQAGTWKITKIENNAIEMTLVISGREVPHVLEFKNDNELTLRVSPTMPRYNDYNRATAENYKRKQSTKKN